MNKMMNGIFFKATDKTVLSHMKITTEVAKFIHL